MAHINMTSPEGTCPSKLKTIDNPRSCSHSGGAGCSSVSYSMFGVPFTQVCGQAIGYQYRAPDGFHAYINLGRGINDPYVDGLSITYDNAPRRHLWTYAVGHEFDILGGSNCSCSAAAGGRQPPSFVGDHYYCDSGKVGPAGNQWYANDPLWDGDGCPTGNTCCDPPNLPWFNRMIDPPSTADIEMRLCQDEATTDENVAVELFELYVY